MDNYLAIRNKLRTFDVLVCEHRNWFWRLVGHVAQVYVNACGQRMVFESTTLNKWSGKSGVQLTPMGLWLQHYPGVVKVRRMTIFNSGGYDRKRRRLEAKIASAKFIQSVRGSSYPNLRTRSGRMKLYLSAIDINIFGHDIAEYDGDDRGIFCSHGVGLNTQAGGLIAPGINCAEYEPGDFYPGGKFEEDLIDAKLGPFEIIKD